MFLKNDFADQFNTIIELEVQMQQAIELLMVEITDPVNSRKISAIQQDEVRHAALIQEILTLIEN